MLGDQGQQEWRSAVTKTDPPDDPPRLRHIDEHDMAYISGAMRGITSVRVRFYQTEPGFRDEFTALLLALEVSAQSEVIERIAPPPHRRYSIQYAATAATITVSQQRPLLG